MMSSSGQFSSRFNSVFLFLGLFSITGLVSGQESRSGFGIAPTVNAAGPCLSQADRLSVRQKIRQSIMTLNLSTDLDDEDVFFQSPVRQASNYEDEGFVAISNYVDHNAAFPGFTQDYNCGSRTYDTQGGYNHRGTDLFSWPFSWNKMDNDQVEIVAAASGTIILKQGNHYDKSCEFNGNPWNAIYIRHADGSVAWYGHLKQSSLTKKEVGDQVQTGDFLGVMGSSGNSTGPHLHFEVYDSNDNLIDPYMGTCNPTTSRSWWADQEPYRIPMVNKLMTNSSPATFGCYGEEVTNQEVNFTPGQQVYFTTFFRDQLTSLSSTHQLITPSGAVFQQWTTTTTQEYDGSWWYRSFNMPATGNEGKWTFKVDYNGKSYTENFYLTSGSGSVDLAFSTDELRFENVQPGAVATESFTITNNGNAGLIVEGIAYPGSFSGNWNGLLHTGDSKEIKVTFSPETEADFSGQLVLRTHVGDLTLPIAASTGCSGINRAVSLDICEGDSYTFGDDVLTEAGNYNNTFLTSAGCDSTVNLTLGLIEPITETASRTVCQGQTYSFGSQQLTTAGSYTETFQSMAGCDSTVNLTLDFTSLDMNVSQNEGILTVAESGAQYQWIDCATNGEVANATSQSFTPPTRGEYKVRVIKADCEQSSDCTMVDLVLGIEQNEISNDLRAYPNPATSQVTVDFGEVAVSARYELISAAGDKMKTGDFKSQKSFMLDLNIPSGMYFLRITDKEGRRSVINLIKQ